MNLAGEWTGYYTVPGIDHPFPLRVKFEALGTILTGTMVDEGSTWTESVDDIVSRMSPRERGYPEWRLFSDENPHATMTWTLPTHSTLSGSVRGRLVRFTKVYDGPQKFIWSGPTFQSWTQEEHNPPTEYVGTLNETGTEIEGRWIISKVWLRGLWRTELNSGGFFFSRAG